MSDLEKQASTWVPPWQRPATTPTSEEPADDPKRGLREEAEQAAARWSATPASADPDDAPADTPDARADADTGTTGATSADKAETDATATGTSSAAEASAAATRTSSAESARTAESGAPSGDTPETRPGRAAEAGGAEAEAPDAAAGRSSRIPGNRGLEQSGSHDFGEIAKSDDHESFDGTPEGAAAMQGAAAGKKARVKKERSADGSLKDGMAVAEMLAKALPEQRSKPRKSDADGEADLEAEAEEEDEPEDYREYEPAEFKAALEAILMVVDEPVSEIVLATVLEVRAEDVANALIDLSVSYTQEGRGFDLRRAAGGWRYYTRSDYAPFVEKFVLDGQQLRLTQASLETLAVVAYKQPVTRARISAIRGVNVDGVIRTLITRGMVEECGTDPDSGGHLYKTTTLFLEKMGLDSVEQLPPLAPFLPDNLEELANGE